MRSRAASLARRLAAGPVAACIAGIACGACAVGDDGDPYVGTTKRVGKAVDAFYVNAGSEPEYLDPGKIADTGSAALAYQLFEGLTKFDPHDDHITQGVAVSWDQSEDNRRFRFHLRPDARWSDGKQVTAHDFVFAWKRVLRPATASRSAGHLYPIMNGEAFNRRRLLVLSRDVSVTAEAREGAKAMSELAKGTVVRVLGRSPLLVESDIAPLPQPVAVKLVSRKKADLKTGTAEQLSFGAGVPPATADASRSWRGERVDVIEAGPVVDCDGDPDRWYRVRGKAGVGWLPGCLTKAAGGVSQLLIAKHTTLPTYLPQPPPSPADEANAALGFIPESATVEDDAVLGVRATDDLTLEVELQRPTPWFVELTAHPVTFPVRKDVIEAFEARGTPDLWTRPESMVSNGPYMLGDWKFRYEITMKENPSYRNRDRLRIKKIVWVEVEEYKPTLSLYKTGELDYLGDSLTLPPEYMPIAEKKKDFARDDYLSVYWYELNTKKPPLGDERVRKALDLAIDKRQLVARVTHGGQEIATHYVPDITGMGYAQAAAADKASDGDPFAGLDHDFDPGRARELLKEAGYDIVREGERFRAVDMPNIEILYNTNEGHKAIAVAIQSMWKQNLGISVTLRNEEWRVMLKNYRDGNFQVMRFSAGADYNHPNTFLSTFESNSAQNQTGWASGTFDEALRRAALEPDPDKSIRLYREAEAIAVAGRARIPLYFYKKSSLIKPYVRGFWGSPFNTHLFEYFWIDPDWERGGANEPAYPALELPKPGRFEGAP